MRYSPYIASVSTSFSQIPQNYTEAVLDWSEPGLQTSFGDYLEYTSPGSGALLYSPINNESRLFRFLGFPANQNIKGSVNATFNNGDSLDNALVNLAFIDWLDRFQVKYKPSSPTELDCLMTWQATEKVLGYCDHYRVSVSDINDGKPMWVGKEASLGIHGIESGETVAVSLTAYDRSDRALGTMDFILYAPTLKLIPERANISGMGYGKQIDTGGVQEIYQSNHNKTLAQLTTPTQSHSVESRSLSTNLPSMDPATVVSSNARDYVNSFDPNNYNQPLDYSNAKAAGAAIAPQATATLNQQHQGNYTLNHQGSLNQTRTVTNDTQVIQAPQINNTVDTYTGTYQGTTFSQTAENYYEQNENELNIINEHNLQAPSYEENVNNLTQEIGTSNINAQSINFNGNTLNINGILYIDGKCDLGFSSGCPPRAFNQPKRVPSVSYSYNQDYIIFISTVYGESSGCSPAAWKAVASTIINRLNNPNFSIPKNGVWVKQTSTTQVIQNGQYMAYEDKNTPYNQAYQYLQGGAKGAEPPKLKDLMAAVNPIYYNHSVTTDATNYYSPNISNTGTVNEAPTGDFQAEVNEGTMQPVNIPGLIPYNPATKSPKFDNFNFFKRCAQKGGCKNDT